jgi:hypothetical protein
MKRGMSYSDIYRGTTLVYFSDGVFEDTDGGDTGGEEC